MKEKGINTRKQGDLIVEISGEHEYAFNTSDGLYSGSVRAVNNGNFTHLIESCDGRRLKLPTNHRYKTVRTDSVTHSEIEELLLERTIKRAREIDRKEDGRYDIDMSKLYNHKL